MFKSIGKTFTLVQALGVVLFILISVVSILGMTRVAEGAAKFSGFNFVTLEIVQNVQHLSQDIEGSRVKLLYSVDSTASRRITSDMAAMDNQLMRFTPENQAKAPYRAQMIALKAAWSAYRPIIQQSLDLAAAGHEGDALQIYQSTDRGAAFQAFDRNSEELRLAVNQRAVFWTTESARTSRLTSLVVIIACIAGVTLAVAMFLMTRRRIVRPLSEVTAHLIKLSEGDLDVPVAGVERRDEIGDMARALEIFREQARSLDHAHRSTREAQAQAEALARHDPLTGLPNRRLFVEGLTRACAQPDQPMAVFLIDLDRFKPINDAYGHEAGDKVLCALAERFAAHRELGSVARLGGDEFAILLPLSGGAAQALQAAELIHRLAVQPVALCEGAVEVGATVGIALWPQDGADPASLLRCADLAMYAAKTTARGTARFFKMTMQEEVEKRARLQADLRLAISADEITPFYQPLVSIDDGRIVGFEMLSRWRHAERGMIMPDDFIPIAEDRGLLPEMTYKVLRQACLDVRTWPAHLTLSVNFSPSQLRDPLLPSRLLAILTETGVAPGRIEVEITENALISDLEATKSILGALQALGMKVALDDFGTGYSSLYHLREMNFDRIKVDKSFVMALGGSQENAQIVQTMLGLGQSLGICTTAEGIETSEQWRRLAGWGCQFGQGYLFGKPLDAAGTLDLLRSGLAITGEKRTAA